MSRLVRIAPTPSDPEVWQVEQVSPDRDRAEVLMSGFLSPHRALWWAIGRGLVVQNPPEGADALGVRA